MKDEDDERDEDESEYASDEEAWNEMCPERGPYESDEDYRDRMQDLEDYAENL